MATVTREQKAIAAWTQAMATAENYAIDPHRHIALLVQAGEQMAALLTPGSAATSPPATVPREREELIAKLAEEAAHLAKVATNTWACVARSKRDFDVIGGLHRDIDAVREKLAAALASAPPAAPPEDAPRKAEHLLAASGVFKGHEGLRGLANAASFWVDHPYGTRLYYGDGGMDYLHRDVLMSAVRVLDTLAASAAPPDPPGLPPRPPLNVPACDLPRYGVTWQGGKTEPLLTPMADGYWTPWHLASQALAARQSDPPGLLATPAVLLDWMQKSKPSGHTGDEESGVCDEDCERCAWDAASAALLAYDLSAPASDLEALVRDIVAWHDARFVQNLGEPFADLIARCRAALSAPASPAPLPPVEVGDVVLLESGGVEYVRTKHAEDYWTGADAEGFPDVAERRKARILAIYRDPLWRRPAPMPTTGDE